MRIEGKLRNTDGELIASGVCQVDRDRNQVTMWPSWELHMLERERGRLLLELDDGSTLDISDKHLTFKLRGTSEQRISVYRLRIIERVPDHMSSGYVEPARAGEQPVRMGDAANEPTSSGHAPGGAGAIGRSERA